MTGQGTLIVSMRMERIGERAWLLYVGDIPQSMLYVTDEDMERSNTDSE